MQTAGAYERRRIIDAAKKDRFCTLIRESFSLEEAAERLDVSLRTVQRERLRDEAFDREIRTAQESHPNPLRLMESAARTHWRAAAWLLERERPERFGRRPANAARKHQVEAALDQVLEAALAATPPEQRAAFYQPVLAAVEQAFQQCFPQADRCNSASSKKCKFPATPLADEAADQLSRQLAAAAPLPAAAGADVPAQLSPKIAKATPSDTNATISSINNPRRASVPPPRNAASLQPLTAANPNPRSSAAQLSPKMREATASDAMSLNAETDPAETISASQTNDPPWKVQLRQPDAARRKKERQAAKQAKAARKRAAASRRRNAA